MHWFFHFEEVLLHKRQKAYLIPRRTCYFIVVEFFLFLPSTLELFFFFFWPKALNFFFCFWISFVISIFFWVSSFSFIATIAFYFEKTWSLKLISAIRHTQSREELLNPRISELTHILKYIFCGCNLSIHQDIFHFGCFKVSSLFLKLLFGLDTLQYKY